MIAESLNDFFVESIASSNEDNSKLRNFFSSRSVSGASYSIPLISELQVYLYGGTVDTVNCFKSYLSDRRQCVKVKGLKSSLFAG